MKKINFSRFFNSKLDDALTSYITGFVFLVGTVIGFYYTMSEFPNLHVIWKILGVIGFFMGFIGMKYGCKIMPKITRGQRILRRICKTIYIPLTVLALLIIVFILYDQLVNYLKHYWWFLIGTPIFIGIWAIIEYLYVEKNIFSKKGNSEFDRFKRLQRTGAWFFMSIVIVFTLRALLSGQFSILNIIFIINSPLFGYGIGRWEIQVYRRAKALY